MIVIDPDSGIAPYEQLRAQIVEAVAAGNLRPGAKLPTVRRLADDLGIAPNTVARSYRELERDGVIVTRGRNGSVISASSASDSGPGAREAAAIFAHRAHELGLTTDEALTLVRVALLSGGPQDANTAL
ncbi:GntR family transcriptional regulator [Cryobacterium sp. PAMC25264]|uniref:GntR family transcriptional regulator n=1 Tax=Cryobacterium sp. PAMC25264 TaxID=2861288 RepID=UPI001C633253|nr:GntR family transcriptional regulator [Cryobacterium sp. PAMC25264]QYF75516.1 GntR family transcriptional regulator [Cryobacterium sp. PAMC25264]